MSVYLDASALVPLFVLDPFSDRVVDKLGTSSIIVSDFASAEFASVVNLRVRARELSIAQAQEAFAKFDGWVATKAESAALEAGDIAVCASYLRRLDLPLRAPDALHIAIAKRLEATLLTFDAKQKTSAKKLGLRVV